MRSIVNNKSYDTEKSEEIGAWSSGDDSRKFGYTEATLYRTMNGAYYLEEYRTYDGVNVFQSYKREIIPITKNEAFRWAQEHLSTEVVESEFKNLIKEA